ncbi:MAG: hypothetical protein MUE53_06405 [Chitinophagales bacterium]|jgi:hypothetical protein|nr:hypothetical protein [Chitinophagales bacterium]
MSLETVIKLGSLYRNSPKIGLKRHRYINQTLNDIKAFEKNKDALGNAITTTIYRIPVIRNDDRFFFDLENIETVFDEDLKQSLIYLNFKTSDKDSDKKYLFGDIIYSNFKDKKGEITENGNYRLSKIENGVIKKKSSFYRGEEVAESLKGTIIEKFRIEFERNIEKIEKLLTTHAGVCIHFSFEEDKQWFELDGVMDLVNSKLMSEFVAQNIETNSISLQKSLFKTIAGVVKDDQVGGVTPNFRKENAYKVKAFKSMDEVIDLLYAVGIAEYVKVSVGKDLGIVVLPSGESLTVELLENFYSSKNTLEKTAEAEDDILDNTEEAESDDSDSLFGKLVKNEFRDDMKFDLVFIKPAGMSTPSVDLVEVSSIEKSLLKEINKRINEVKSEINNDFEAENLTAKKSLTLEIKYCFKNILSDKTKAEKKYHFHLLKVLPQIYTGTYFQDPILLPAFIEKVERNTRDGLQNFNYFKYEFYYLMKIQNFDNLMTIKQTKSYSIGKNLGIMAEPFAAWRDDCPIKSFEKSYVGNLTRRISNLEEVSKFSVFLNEKLVIHEKTYLEIKEAYQNLLESLGSFGNEKYDKNACALGFFESYFAIRNKKETEK